MSEMENADGYSHADGDDSGDDSRHGGATEGARPIGSMPDRLDNLPLG
jgi:hypothetical protein